MGSVFMFRFSAGFTKKSITILRFASFFSGPHKLGGNPNYFTRVRFSFLFCRLLNFGVRQPKHCSGNGMSAPETSGGWEKKRNADFHEFLFYLPRFCTGRPSGLPFCLIENTLPNEDAKDVGEVRIM